MGYNNAAVEEALKQQKFDDCYASYLLLGRRNTEVNNKKEIFKKNKRNPESVLSKVQTGEAVRPNVTILQQEKVNASSCSSIVNRGLATKSCRGHICTLCRSNLSKIRTAPCKTDLKCYLSPR